MGSMSMPAVSFFSSDSHSEPERKDFAVAGQGELALARKPRPAGVSLDIVRAQKAAGAALALACAASGLEDKEIYLALEIGASHFSEMKAGRKHFPADKVAALCEVVGNTIYPEWIASRVGCYLRPMQTELERRLELSESARVEAERKLEWLTEFVAGTRR